MTYTCNTLKSVQVCSKWFESKTVLDPQHLTGCAFNMFLAHDRNSPMIRCLYLDYTGYVAVVVGMIRCLYLTWEGDLRLPKPSAEWSIRNLPSVHLIQCSSLHISNSEKLTQYLQLLVFSCFTFIKQIIRTNASVTPCISMPKYD